MRILLATGLYPPQIGGPAQYVKHIENELTRQGHDVFIATYGLEKIFPIGLRHFFFFLKVLLRLKGVSLVIAFDTFSTGLPALFATHLFNKKIIVRVGGDFLWESYVNRAADAVRLSEFYTKKRQLSIKEKCIQVCSIYFFKQVDAIAFTTEWQKNIFLKPYNLMKKKVYVVENYYGEKQLSVLAEEKNFIWAARSIPLKNVSRLKKAFQQAQKINSTIKLDVLECSHEELQERVRTCYAVILPSYSEVSPNFIIEALCFNKPFILTEDTGLHDKLDGMGLFVDPFDENNLTEKILCMATDTVYQECRKQIIQFNDTHSWSTITDEYLSIYKDIQT